MASTSILYRSPDSNLFLIDTPGSIEDSQGHSSQERLLSSSPQEVPFRSLEPKSAKAKANALPISLEDLLLSRRLEFALGELRDGYEGPWCLPRVYKSQESQCHAERDISATKRQKTCCEVGNGPEVIKVLPGKPQFLDTNGSFVYHNQTQTSINIRVNAAHDVASIPPGATSLSGSISATLPAFVSTAPNFSMIVLDPPWPNRSARRSKSYSTSYATPDIRQLLSSIPLEDYVAEQGLVAIWITNKATFREMVIGEGGLFEQWGVQLVEEWIWLKTTKSGEPICALDSTWRKPYEILLVGRRGAVTDEVKRRIMVGVPDLHSRKPNLKYIFDAVGLVKSDWKADCLEIFARNLTAGWWAWGNEVLKFQMEDCWVDSPALMQCSIVIPQDT